MKHVTSSPCFPQSNGMVERSIETLKGILFKVHQSQGDPNLALIEYNNTPKQNLPSPAEMLMGRVLRSLTPVKNILLKPKFPTTKTLQMLKQQQREQKGKYDKKSSSLKPLNVNQKVYVQMAHRNWSPAIVIEEHQTPRSYIVQLENGSEIRRNRVHIRPDNGIANDNL
ncbi:hypothetical protein JTE90_010934 [Oedothorax gibbosus]|uniref:Integrase catalytic domain-containing protein n=1 Tax=Oedothorax gibbosus TaxID=931172 RepID=A0AAV6TRD7_9ARAC|nr:hypothetical protein JTE90_010934 [Oedothorax gibbosus]